MDKQAYDCITEQEQATQLRVGLETIDGLTRRGLLVLLDKEASKSNTARLRKRARMLFIGGTLRHDEIWHAVDVEVA
jgi:hypothetical protein